MRLRRTVDGDEDDDCGGGSEVGRGLKSCSVNSARRASFNLFDACKSPFRKLVRALKGQLFCLVLGRNSMRSSLSKVRLRSPSVLTFGSSLILIRVPSSWSP